MCFTHRRRKSCLSLVSNARPRVILKRGETKEFHETSTLSKISNICVWLCRVVGNALGFTLHGNEHFYFFLYKNWTLKSPFQWNVTLLLWKTNLCRKTMFCEPSLSLISLRSGRKFFCPTLFLSLVLPLDSWEVLGSHFFIIILPW